MENMPALKNIIIFIGNRFIADTTLDFLFQKKIILFH